MKKALSTFALAMLVLLSACEQQTSVQSDEFLDEPSGTTWQEQYDLGMRYLSESNYTEAIIAFTTAIEIEPKRSAAYEGLADAYIGLGDIERAIKALEDGIANTNDTALQKKLDDLKLLQSTTETGETSGRHFFEADLEEWGYPIGLSIYDLISRGEADESDLQKLEKDRDASWAGRGAATRVSESPAVFVEYYNGLVGSVRIDEDNHFIGPRGVALGMQIYEVLQLFRCDNEYSLNADYYDLMQMLEPDELTLVYRNVDRVDKTTKKQTGHYDAYLHILNRDDVPCILLQYDCFENSEGGYVVFASMAIWFNETGAFAIHVSYQYN